jgi:glycosyltransferase involved in cell wall biosynthesis
MRLLVVNWRDPKHPLSGGAETHIHNIATRLVRVYGHEVLFVSNSADGRIPSYEEYDGIRFIRFGNEYNFNFLVMGRLKKIVRRHDIDLVIEDVNKIPFYSPLYLRRPVMLVIPHLFSETIYRQTNFAFGTYIYLAERLMLPVYRNCHVHVISNSTRDDLARKGYRSGDISVAECGIEQDIYRPGGEKAQRPTVCYTGRLKKYKSIDHLLYAASIVVKKIPDARFVLIGDGDYLKVLKSLTRKLNLQDHVEFPGFISVEDKVRLLQESHCLAYTSVKEGWGISNIEANACGTTVVAADVDGLRDSVDNGRSGLLYRYGDIEDLAGKITSILTDDRLRKKLEEGAVKWAGRFTWDNTAAAFNSILEKRYPELYSGRRP